MAVVTQYGAVTTNANLTCVAEKSKFVIVFLAHIRSSRVVFPQLIEVRLAGDGEGNIFVTCAGKKEMGSYLPFSVVVISAGKNITLSRCAPLIYEFSASG